MYANRTVKDCLTVALLLVAMITTAPAALIESARGPHAELTTYTQPALGQTVTQPETGVVIERMTDAVQLKARFGGIANIATTVPYAGLTNYYSRRWCMEPQGRYWLAAGTTSYAILHGITEGPMRVVQSPHVTAGKAGKDAELQWHPDGFMTYCGNGRLWKQTVDGTETEMFDFGVSHKSTGGDGMWSADGRYLALFFADLTVRVYDYKLDDVVCAFPVAGANGVDISPSGEWVKVDNWFYSRSTGQRAWTRTVNGAERSLLLAGHGGWDIAADGRECFVSQQGPIGWITAFFPDNGEFRYLQRMPGEDGTPAIAGMHAGSDKTGNTPGWSANSTYSSTRNSPLGNEVYLLEIKSQKRPGVRHPEHGGTTAEFRSGDVDAADMPRVIRIADMNNHWQAPKERWYFAEGFASEGPGPSVWWASNSLATGPLDVYRAVLPADVLKAMQSPGTAPTPPPVPTVTPTPQPTATATPAPTVTPTPDAGAPVVVRAISGSKVFTSNNQQAGICPVYRSKPIELRKYLKQVSEFDHWALLAFEPIPPGVIIRADLVLKSAYAQDGYIVPEASGVPLRPVPVAWMQPRNEGPTTDTRTIGAGWRFRAQTYRTDLTAAKQLYAGEPWSASPSTAPYGYPGDLSSVLPPLYASTVRLDFPPMPGATWRTDVTALARAMQAGESHGCVIDSTNLRNVVTGGANPNDLFRAAIENAFSPDGPRLEVWYRNTDPHGPTPTPTPVVTPTPTPGVRVVEVKPGETIVIKGVQ